MREQVDSGRPLDIESALRTYLTGQCGAPVQVSALRLLAGGASHETWSFDALLASGECLPLILRRSFAHGLLDGMFESEFDPPFEHALASEFALLRALHRAKLPVPQPRWCAASNTELATPFMIVERAAGADLRKVLAVKDGLLAQRAPGRQAHGRHELGMALVRIQAGIHAMVWQDHLGDILPAPAEHGALREVERWARAIEAPPRKSRPLLAAALGWLRTNPPDISHVCLLHGDFKTNNLVFEDGRATVLDWEMAHLGDPVEDLAWTTLWSTRDDLVGGLLSKAEYLAAYEVATGNRIEPARFFYWEMFSYVKLAAIFIAGARPTPDGEPARPLLALLGRAIPALERALSSLLQQTLLPTVTR